MSRKSFNFLIFLFFLNGFLFSPLNPNNLVTSEESTLEIDSSHHDQYNCRKSWNVSSNELNTTSHSYIEEFDNDFYWNHLISTASGWGHGRIELGKNLTAPIYIDTGGGASNSTRAVFGGGRTENTITYLTIASTGDSQDFGDLTQARGALGSCSTPTRAVWMGGYLASPYPAQVTIDYVTIATTGNAADFGDLKEVQRSCPGLSDSHGGLGD